MAASVPDESYETLEALLLNKSGKTPLHERFRVLFTLKSLKTERAINIISEGFTDPSALLKHELAYCLGQMNNTTALPVLESVLRNTSEDPMVRHEAAEAMGAISSPTSIPVLKQYMDDSHRAVRETCEIALAKIEWDNSEEGQRHRAQSQEGDAVPFTSIDPAPPSSGLLSGKPKSGSISKGDVSRLRDTLLDASLPLFERYRAMFALRNIGTAEAVDALAAGFKDDSELFRHEIAFVFGQLLSVHSVPSLLNVLQNPKEADMVRHEAAEALGGIATPDVLPHLKEWMTRPDSPQVVRESCQIAVDMWEYENSDQFQYADGLLKNSTAEAVSA
ncbi:ARM repeat-containing protein [Rickenella mellea]|uniref:Deoxyhypusine hydroxylase n=1 Tax=Rickenella mellea TaxID=50990 RepID=A0A4Y7Q482_9AGAM|nr:ARM repeat-containing protein [Rickenella mellea]